MFKEFKKFIMTGNVIDLAVAVLLAGAVGLVVLVILFFGCKSRVKKYIAAKLAAIKTQLTSLNG